MEATTFTLQDVLAKLNCIDDKISANTLQLNDFKNDFKNEIAKLRKEFEYSSQGTTKSLVDLNNKYKNMEDSQSFISKQFEDHKKMVENVVKKNVQIENENSKLNNLLKTLQHQLKEETIKRDELEAYGRRTCVEVSGIPYTEGEDCAEIATTVAELIKIEGFRKNTIDVAHRVSQKDSANIIIKFKSRTARDSFHAHRHNLKGMTVHNLSELLGADNVFAGITNKIFVNESLTAHKKALFWKARNASKDLGWTGKDKEGRCWTKNGQIFVKEHENAKNILIRHDGDLDKIK